MLELRTGKFQGVQSAAPVRPPPHKQKATHEDSLAQPTETLPSVSQTLGACAGFVSADGKVITSAVTIPMGASRRPSTTPRNLLGDPLGAPRLPPLAKPLNTGRGSLSGKGALSGNKRPPPSPAVSETPKKQAASAKGGADSSDILQRVRPCNSGLQGGSGVSSTTGLTGADGCGTGVSTVPCQLVPKCAAHASCLTAAARPTEALHH